MIYNETIQSSFSIQKEGPLAWLSCLIPICRRLFKTSESGEKRDGHTPAGNYMFKVKNSNTRTRCEICSKLTIKKTTNDDWRSSDVFIVTFEHISHLALVFLLLTLSR